MKVKSVCCHGKFGWITLAVLAGLIIFWQSGLWDWRYSAVSTDSGQLYFGKLAWSWGDFVTIRDAYYLKLSQVTTKNEQGETVNQPDISLIKVGAAELYSPGDTLELAKQHILAIQPVGKDSKVMEGMEKQRNQKTGDGSQETAKTNE